MPEVFLSSDAGNLLKNKKVHFFGDSNMRTFYKDLIVLLQSSDFVKPTSLKSKLEKSFSGDKLLSHSALGRGRDFREERRFLNEYFDVSFTFITNIYKKYTIEKFEKVAKSHPDLIIINSCIWDITRWGNKSIADYQQNLNSFFQMAEELLDEECLLIWITCPPVSLKSDSGFIIEKLGFMNPMNCFNIIQANYLARNLVEKHNFNFINTYSHFQHYLHLRAKDGIHWLSPAIRYTINLILTHVSVTWSRHLPGRVIPYTSRWGYPGDFRDVLQEMNLIPTKEILLQSKGQEITYITPEHARLKKTYSTPKYSDDYILIDFSSPEAFKYDLHYMEENYRMPFRRDINSFAQRRQATRNYQQKKFEHDRGNYGASNYSLKPEYKRIKFDSLSRPVNNPYFSNHRFVDAKEGERSSPFYFGQETERLEDLNLQSFYYLTNSSYDRISNPLSYSVDSYSQSRIGLLPARSRQSPFNAYFYLNHEHYRHQDKESNPYTRSFAYCQRIIKDSSEFNSNRSRHSSWNPYKRV